MFLAKIRRSLSIEFCTALIICCAYVVWMLSLPCFPSEDAPVHMYYVHVLSALLFHNNPEYQHFFRIRHILPPYSLYYYSLLVLSKFVSMFLADRLIICLYFISFVFGFRYLAQAIGPAADRMTLLAVLLLMNWPLGMGFVNFCLSLSFSFWAIGLWMRIMGTGSLRGRIAFLILVTAIMLTHPVPLLLVLAVAGTLLLVHVVQASRGGRLELPPHAKADLLTLAVAALNLGYVKLFTLANPLKQIAQPDAAPVSYWHGTLMRVGMYAREHALPVIVGHGLDIFIYRAALLLILVVAMLLAARQRMRNRSAKIWTPGDTFLLLAAILFIGLPFIPSQLNGLYYFADRLVLCVWLAFLLAASGWSKDPHNDASPRTEPVQHRPLIPGAAWAWAGFALVCNAAVLVGVNRIMRPTAESIAALEHTTIAPVGQIGFVFEDPRLPKPGVQQALSWNPYYWALIHVFRHNDAVLANAPWMNETILPVAASTALPEVSIPALQEPFPTRVQPDLLASPPALNSALHAASFFVVNQFDRAPLNAAEPLLHQESTVSNWSCTTNSWYRLCRRPPAAFQP